MNESIRQVSRLSEIDGPTLRAVQQEVRSIEQDWTSVYTTTTPAGD